VDDRASVELFWRNVGLFWHNMGLFWRNVGLFWRNVGLFCVDDRANVWLSRWMTGRIWGSFGIM